MSTLQFKVRLGEDLHAAIKAAAEENNRSVNAEIIYRLQQSFETQYTSHIMPMKRSDNLVTMSKDQHDYISTDKLYEKFDEIMAKMDELLGKSDDE